MLYYCKKCGRQIGFELCEKKNKICDICNSELYEVPHEYTDNFRWRDGDGKQAIIDELVKPSQEFDQYLFDHCDEILAKQKAEFNAKLEIGQAIIDGRKVSKKELLSGHLDNSSATPSVTCPYCKSSNTHKISATSKAVNTVLFGIFGTKRHKQWHCNKCGSDF